MTLDVEKWCAIEIKRGEQEFFSPSLTLSLLPSVYTIFSFSQYHLTPAAGAPPSSSPAP